MKFILITIFIFLFQFSNGQYGDIYLGNWIISKVETLDSTVIYGDIKYSRLSIGENSKIKLYKGSPINNSTNYYYGIYSVTNGKFKIKIDSVLEFNVDKISNNDFIISRNNERYFFNKLIVSEKLFSVDYKIIDNDTLSIYTIPNFNGDITKYFCIKDTARATKLIKASFVLRKNKTIDNIRIDSTNLNSTTIHQIRNLIQDSKGKWKPALSENSRKTDDIVNLYIMLCSSDLSGITQKNHSTKGQKIFLKALELQKENQNDLAEYYYNEYISLYNYLIHNTSYIGLGAVRGYLENINRGYINRAALKFEIGNIKGGCQDLKSVCGIKADVLEVENYIKEICK